MGAASLAATEHHTLCCLQDCLASLITLLSIPGMQFITKLHHKCVYQSGWYQLIGCQRKLGGSMVKGQVTSRFSPTLDRMVKRSCFDTKHQTPGSAGTIPRKSRSVDEYLRNLFHTICLPAQRTVCGVYHKDSCAKERQIIAKRAFAPGEFYLFSTSLCRIQSGWL